MEPGGIVKNKSVWVLIAALASLAVAGLALNATVVSEAVVRRVLASRKGVVVRDVHIARQRFLWPGRLEWEGVTCAVEVNAKKATVEAPSVTLTGLQGIFSARRHILISARGARLAYDKGEARDVTAALTLEGAEVGGPVTMGALAWDQWQARDVSFFLVMSAAGVQTRAVECQAYDGRISGKAVINLAGVPAYALEFLVEGLDVARMDAVNAGLAERLSGRVKGSLKVAGDAAALRALETDFMMPAGGRISAAFLASLARYLPRSREKERLGLLVKNGGKLVMEGFSFTMKGDGKGRYSGEVHLKSREVNLELNLTHEISTDGTLVSLLTYMDRFLR